MASGSPPPPAARSLPLTDKVGYLALVLVLVALGFQFGHKRGVESERAAASEDFYPDWAATTRNSEPLWVRDTDSALGRINLHPKQLTLKNMASMHGHLCDGLVISWIELRAALRELFPQRVVERTDLRVVSKNGPCWVDAAAWMTGTRVNHGTLVLDNTVGNGFIVQRVSKGEAVRAWLRPGVFPAELAELERSIRARRSQGTAVEPEEIDRAEALAAELSKRLLNQPAEEVVEVERLADFDFPAQSPNLIAPRGDIINRDAARTTH